MWYNARPVLRRGMTLTLLAIIAVQLLGGITLASACFEPCPDDTSESSCPPICATCTTCAHSRHAIVQASVGGVPIVSALDAFLSQVAAPTSRHAVDIFHVPLVV